MAFTATWNKKVIATNQALIGTVPDPLHAAVHPHDVEYGANPDVDSWVSQVPNPGTVSAVEGENSIYITPQQVQGGPIDYTPVDHTTGEGAGAALSTRDSQEENSEWHETDYNATAARRWTAPPDVDYHQVAERLQEQEPDGQLGSPETVALHVGTNKESYPNTSTGHRIHRWRDRVQQRIQWQTDHRPLYTPNAYSAVNRPAGASSNVSPYPSLGQVNTVMQMAPQLRRVPEVWTTAVTVDGQTTPAHVVEPPLDVWGQ
jgi:hypothetical protein